MGKKKRMTKYDVRTFDELVLLARESAERSLNRADPIAWAYWVETERFADDLRSEGVPDVPAAWIDMTRSYVQDARAELETGRPMLAALLYSRAKWIVILGRNNGITMNPRVTHVNMDWLEDILPGEAV